MGSHFLLANNDSPEIITVKFEGLELKLNIKHFIQLLPDFAADS